MNNSMTIREEVCFTSSIEKVWDLLINPSMTKQYMFGCEIISDWEIGSPVLWQGSTEDGKLINYVKGQVVEFEALRKINTTTFDPNSDMEDIPANYVNLIYELSETNRGTLLVITQGDFYGAAEGKKRYEESIGGWKELVIPAMKKLLGE